jgi:RNA polymerase sigma-70 factor (ECF subfamily)
MTQETFLKVYRHFGRYRGDASLKTWICRIAINQARSTDRWWRRRSKSETSSLDEPLSSNNEDRLQGELIPSSEASPEAVAIKRERSRQVEQALGNIKKDFGSPHCPRPRRYG